MAQVIRKKTPYRIETWVCNALSFVSLLDLGWHHSTKEYTWWLFYRGGLDFHFNGAALHKTDSLTVLITYLFAICVNILQYHTAFTILLPTDASPSTPIKWKPSLIPTASKQIIHYKMNTWVQVIRKKTPYRIENWVCNASSLVSLLGM